MKGSRDGDGPHGFGRKPGWLLALCAVAGSLQAQQAHAPDPKIAAEIRHGRELLQSREFAEAKRVFGALVKTGNAGVQAQLGLGDAELGLHQYEAAEAEYRAVVAQQPELWQAHKNLVVVEAALGRWEEFDGERKILRLARERGAPGISGHESDVIDSFNVGGQHWVVRAYFEPMGRSQALYNFERFSPEGRVEAYISLEDAAAAQAALTPQDERVGATASGTPPGKSAYALNWYTGAAHGSLKHYPAGPAYVRAGASRCAALAAKAPRGPAAT